jgi:DNA-binding NarL/FixJ family response regulator
MPPSAPDPLDTERRLLLVDDHALFREGVEGILAVRRPGLRLHCLPGADAAEEILCAAHFDLVLLDLALGNDDGLALLEAWQARWPGLRIALLSGSLDARHILRAIELGACGFIPKTCSGAVLTRVIDLLLAGGTYVPPELLAGPGTAVGGRIAVATALEALGEEASQSPLLTPRQNEVLKLLADGCSNKDIARRLEMADGTVRAHINALFRILDVSNRTQAVVRAQQLHCL